MTDSVTAPPTRPPRYSLEESSVGAEEQWEGRPISWPGERCTSPALVADVCAPGTFEVPDELGHVSADPYVAWEGSKCSTFGGNEERALEQARERLVRWRSAQVERELWLGTQEPGNPHLSTGATNLSPGGAPQAALRAIVELQQAIASTGTRGFIHATHRTVGTWLALDVLHREGNLLFDHFDNVVVAGVGYPGTGPSGEEDVTGDSAWAYATGPVIWRTTDIETAIDINHGTNLRTALASQLVLAVFDPCTHFTINVSHCAIDCTVAEGS